jgi:hypothetical protein
MGKSLLKVLKVIVITSFLISSAMALAVQSGQAAAWPWNFTVTLKPDTWQTYILGPASNGGAYLVDITPLNISINGAYVKSIIVPEYDGTQWNDVLRMMIPAEFPEQQVKVVVYQPPVSATVFDATTSLEPGVWHGFAFAAIHDYQGAYLADFDPLAASDKGATFMRYLIHSEYPWGAWLDVLRVQTEAWLSGPLPTRLRVYLVSALPLVADFNVTLTKQDTWTGFIVGPASLNRAYVVRAIPLATEVSYQDLNQYIIQPEFDGQQWNDVLRIQMGNLDAPWVSIDYNFKIYAFSQNLIFLPLIGK